MNPTLAGRSFTADSVFTPPPAAPGLVALYVEAHRHWRAARLRLRQLRDLLHNADHLLDGHPPLPRMPAPSRDNWPTWGQVETACVEEQHCRAFLGYLWKQLPEGDREALQPPP